MPIRFTPLGDKTDLLVTPVRHASVAEGTYAFCSYAIMSKNISHLLVMNPSPRSVQIPKDAVVGICEPFTLNTPYSYYGATSAVAIQSMPKLPEMSVSCEAKRPTPPTLLNTTASVFDKEQIQDTLLQGPLQHVVPTLGLNQTDLTWHDGLDVPVDAFGLEDEFKEKGPLAVQPVDTEDESAPPNMSQMERRAWDRERDRQKGIRPKENRTIRMKRQPDRLPDTKEGAQVEKGMEE